MGAEIKRAPHGQAVMQTDQEAGLRLGAALCSSAQPDGGQSLFQGQRGAIENVSAQQKHDPVVALKCSEESQKPAEGSAGVMAIISGSLSHFLCPRSLETLLVLGLCPLPFLCNPTHRSRPMRNFPSIC